MSAVPASIVCERVRAQVSLQLDDALSQLEQRMVAAHIARCEDCCAYAEDVAAFTHGLRLAPLEPLAHPVVVRRSWRPALVRLQVSVAAVLAIATVGVASQLSSPTRHGPTISKSRGTVSQFPTQAQFEGELAILESARRSAPVSASRTVL